MAFYALQAEGRGFDSLIPHELKAPQMRGFSLMFTVYAYPNSEDFGYTAWCFTYYESMENKYNFMRDIEAKKWVEYRRGQFNENIGLRFRDNTWLVFILKGAFSLIEIINSFFQENLS